jgi:hypothetical protein
MPSSNVSSGLASAVRITCSFRQALFFDLLKEQAVFLGELGAEPLGIPVPVTAI